MFVNSSDFNQTTLNNSIANEELSFMCTPDYVILLLRGVKATDPHTFQWVNILSIYKLPYMKQIGEVTLHGRVSLPKSCKQANWPNKYQFGIITTDGPALLNIDHLEKVKLTWLNDSAKTPK
jgi:hypothetical protein